MTPNCRKCGIVLTNDNWHISKQKGNRRICITCEAKYSREWYHRNRDIVIDKVKQRQRENPEKANEKNTRSRRKHGIRSYKENRKCALYLGVHVAERVLSHVFKDIERMPLHNPGYDFRCSYGRLIDVKSACFRKNGNGWKFNVSGDNEIADYFLCLAFDNREDLIPLHAWLLPNNKSNPLKAASISISTISKWDKYELDISKISDCCNEFRSGKMAVIGGNLDG